MSRRIAMLSVLGVLAAGFGCKHIGGKCDCGYSPSDAAPQGLTAPYPAQPVPGTTSVPSQIPPAGTSGAARSVPNTMPANPMLR